MKILILTFSSVLMKIYQISHVLFQTTSQFFLKFHMTLITPLYFFLSNIIYFAQTGPINQSTNFLDFLVLGSKFTKFLSFLKQKISFSSNFAPLFGIMGHNSSILFLAETLYTFSKIAYQSTNLVKFHLSSRNSEILHCGGGILL